MISTYKVNGITFIGITEYPLNPTNGDVVYRSDLGKIMTYQSNSWKELGGGGGGSVSGSTMIKSFMFGGPVYVMDYDQPYIVTSNCTLYSIAISAIISGLSGNTTAKIEVRGKETTTILLPANNSVNSKVEERNITLVSGDIVYVSITGTATDRLEDVNVDLYLKV